MTKRLYLLRHSKAGQTDKSLTDDHARKLTEKGIELCPSVAEHLNEAKIMPELILSSTASRCRETVEHLLTSLNKNIKTVFVDELYLASVDNIFSEIEAVDDDVDALMIVGHNPGMQQSAIALAGKGNKKAFRTMRAHFPPAALAVFDLDINEWTDIGMQKAELIDFLEAEKPE